eukprot:1323051-Pyramimonas_sp.AAC.1
MTCDTLKQPETHALALIRRTVAVSRTSRSRVLHRISLPCIETVRKYLGGESTSPAVEWLVKGLTRLSNLSLPAQTPASISPGGHISPRT